MNFIPNISPKAFTFSATVVGFLLIDDSTANEQNALGNWLMLVAQVLCTNAYYMQVQSERGNSSNIPSDTETMDMLKKMVNALNEEIEEIKKNL